MTDIGEAIAVAVTTPDKDEPCWYCEKEPEKKGVKNEEVADPETSDSEDEEQVPENDEHNDASKLGSNLGSPPEYEIECPLDNDIKVPITVAAHHCIPGNASLKKATDLHDFMREGGPFSLLEDIGYDVNHENNGVWLSGNYAVRGGKLHYTKNWGGYDSKFKNAYAKNAMDKSHRQFHDAHSKYNGKVLKTLESLAEKLGDPEDKCPICDKKLDATRPPYGLVNRLDRVSSEHRRMISNMNSPNIKKTVTAGYYTSSRVKKYLDIE